MASIRTLAALSSVALITSCATAPEPASNQSAKANANADEHASHHPAGAASAPATAAAPMQDRMRAMQEMHDKMMNAKTPEERQALMADHMKAMQDGVQMMEGMGGAMGGMDAKGMPADMAQRQRMMEGRMDMMQMMMSMMMQRMPASGAAPATK